MASLPLQIVRVDQDQRGDSDDFNYANSLALDNLYLALKNLLGTGWLQPGTMEWVGPGMECYLRTPCGAITAEGLALLADDYPITPDDGDADNPRIDLVSIGWQAANAAAAQKWKINQATEVPYEADVYTRVQHTPVITLTKGTPAATPSCPSTPANHVALWEIYVEADATTLSDAVFTPVPSGIANKAPSLSIATWPGPGAATQALPYVTGTLLSCASKGSIALIVATVAIVTQSTDPQHTPLHTLFVTIEDATSGDAVGRTIVHLGGGEYQTVVILGQLAAPSQGTRNYRLRIADGGYPVADELNTYVVVPAVYPGTATAVENLVAVLSL